jgi:hypothetical protein
MAVDKELATSLKLAKGKEMYFAFIPKGSDGKLLVSKRRIPPKEIADAKKELGGGKPVIGKCIGPVGAMVFKVAKASATLPAAIKKVAKRDAGLTVIAEIQLASEIAALEAEEEGGKPEAPEAPPAPPAPPVQESAAGGRAAGGRAAPEEAAAAGGEAAPPDGSAAPEGEIDLSPWQAARDNAIKELRALATKVAGTKHKSAAGVIKEIQTIISKLPPAPKANDLKRIRTLIETDDTITAAEESPGHFHALKIRDPLLSAIDGMMA